MYPELLQHLCCPTCHNGPLLLSGSARVDAHGAIETAMLRCQHCGAAYAVRHGIVDTLRRSYRPDTPAQIVNVLPLTAWAYERLWRHRALTLLGGEPFGYQRELPLIVGLADVRQGGLYVDSACSNGLYARALARALGTNGHVVAIDHSLPMLRQGRAFAQQAGLRISFVRALSQRLPLAAAGASGVVMGGSLNEIGDLDGCLAETERVLAPGRPFVSMHLVAAASSGGRALQRLLGTGGVVFHTATALQQRFRAHGLRPSAHWRYGVVTINQYLKAKGPGDVPPSP
jgi:ubiquinone/menaquinone biosynthesis C-methylase UbiE/uncharacterized protein YbaR (Trm112 family)